MLNGLICRHRLGEELGFLLSAAVHNAFMAIDGVTKHVLAYIQQVHPVIAVPWMVLMGCMDQCQTQGIVIGFVPAISAIAEDGYAITAVFSGDVGPFLSRYFSQTAGIVRTFNCSQA
ncbi:hypothetical protein BN3661_01840 [Eubacteriaceae bacterium CHKCI005]|nr:hypothetical protein BN3661_01840 [Eubacteriaceae bacterium CHKCI005]